MITFRKSRRYAVLLTTTPTEGRSGYTAKKPSVVTKTLRVMQLSAVFILGLCLQAAATGFSQQVTFSGKNVPLSNVLTEVKKQTGYEIIYENALDFGNVTVHAKRQALNDFLKTILTPHHLDYTIESKTIFIKPTAPIADLGQRLELANAAPPVTGIVRGPDGQPLAGVNVVLKGTTKGTVTDKDGKFSIDAKIGDKLVVSSIGFGVKEITVSGVENIVIVLEVTSSPLDEVQIIAYGQTSKRLNTGNVSTVKAADIEKQPVNNPLYALQGRVPGLQVTPTSGLTGGAVNIQIRGKNSLRQISEPLIVVNGLPIANNIQGISGNDFAGLSQLSTLSFLNINDIESIEVLKDADATSIYGSRGSNGVILITTKKGKADQTTITLNGQTGWATVPKKIDLLNTPQYLELRKEAFSNSGVDFINRFPYGGPEEFKYLAAQDLFLWDQKRNTDWQKELIGGTARYNDFQGSISGGSHTVQYLIGGNYHKETTVFPGNNSDQRGSANISLTGTSPNERLKAILSTSYMADWNTLPTVDFTERALRLAPNAPSIYNEDGSLNWALIPAGSKSWNNPMYNINNAYSGRISNLLANADITYRFLPFLSVKTQLGYNELKGSSVRIVNPFKDRSPDDITDPGSSYFNTNGSSNVSIEPQLLINMHISKGVLESVIGGSFQTTKTESQQIGASGFTSDALFKNLASATDYFLVENTSSQYNYAAVFGRVKYNWENKYLINVALRNDGSSKFGPGNQFGTFGSVGAAWIFTEERVIKSSIPLLSFGKLRVSYGSSGNDGIPNYGYLERYEPVTAGLYDGFRGNRTRGLFNSYFAWERTKKMEAGIDLGVKHDKVIVTASYFRDRSDNQLLNYPYPTMAGPGFALVNLPALIQNSGVELSLSSRNISSRNFSWSTEINFTSNKNKLISYENFESSPYYGDLEIGEPFSGVFKAYSYSGVNVTTGRYEFKAIDKETTYNPLDENRLDRGKFLRLNTAPRFYGGVSNTFSWRGITLDILFQYSKQLAINPFLNYEYNIGFPGNLPVDYYLRWQKPGDVADIQKLYSEYPDDYSSAIDRKAQSNAVYKDGSFVRLKNLSLSYKLPMAWTKGASMKSLDIYVHGQNLWTLTSYKGFDPETKSVTSLPPLKVLTIGLRALF